MSLTVGVAQFAPIHDKSANYETVRRMMKDLVGQGAELIVLPEMFVHDFVLGELRAAAEEIPGPTTEFLQGLAKEHKVWIVGGTMPELCGEKLYNTCQVIDPDGKLIGIYRKQRLYRASIPGKITVNEGDLFTPGDQLFAFDAKGFRIGIAVCFDLRFAEIAIDYSVKENCNVLIYPSAFHTSTGPLHWKTLGCARALDSQSWLVNVSASNDSKSRFSTHGCSFVSNPMGQCVCEIGPTESTLVYTIDMQTVINTRQALPVVEIHKNL